MTTTPMKRSLIHDSVLMTARELKPTLADPFYLIFGLVQPIFFLLLFGPLVHAEAGTSLSWFVPGILVMIALFSTAGAGSGLHADMIDGSFERILVTPLSRPVLFLGKSLKEFFPIVIQAVVITVATVFFGFRPNPFGLLLGMVLLGIIGIGIGAFSYTLALVTRKNDWMFWIVQQTLLFPLMILSGILLPLDGAPAWMRVLSAANPLAHVVNAERDLFAGQLTTGNVGWGFFAALLTAGLGILAGLRALRSTSR
ncbi:ABC transporter permease [Arachnia propionica]|uniref:Transport permease protein n=2 Tax=Arachnia propionica TaxID=1750 RepID=A0A3P1TA51_9ACTN|nr:ABC transporter permease [Arachnia propionica]